MDITNAKDLILDTLSSFGDFGVIIITAIASVSVSFLLFRFGWNLAKRATK